MAWVPAFIVVLVLNYSNEFAVANSLHKTPPMGFSSWNTFYAENNEQKMMEVAQAIKRLNLDKYGYIYLTIDDFWQTRERDQRGFLQTNVTRFPQGMRFLSNYVHKLGLKFGLYSNAGYRTCGGMAGSLGFEENDVKLFLDYDIDYLKYDNCYPKDAAHKHHMDYDKSLLHLPSYYQDPPERPRFEIMSRAIQAVSAVKNITMELCLYGWGNVEKWGPNSAQIWRTSGDISDNWNSVLRNLDRNDEERFVHHQGPTLGWNYPDALFVGKGGMTDIEYKTMFSMWCIVKSPLMLGSDIRGLKKSSPAYKILTNTELLDINQDSLGNQATCVKNCCSRGVMGGIDSEKTCPWFKSSFQIWKGRLSRNSFVVAIINRFDQRQTIDFLWMDDVYLTKGQTFSIRDLWKHTNLPSFQVNETASFSKTLEPHDCAIFKLIPSV
ncbi:uncharacterized protein LOC131883741 [Tigriopus californicus]|uniref:uncharacterized protein LOC131883741 n=1 Tax=Tigriopus californicus TaxID=6832 RepID=UPI0027DA6C4A|nr:uncharacterized protein LOC131883741 [Tigriopus californicus]